MTPFKPDSSSIKVILSEHFQRAMQAAGIPADAVLREPAGLVAGLRDGVPASTPMTWIR